MYIAGFAGKGGRLVAPIMVAQGCEIVPSPGTVAMHAFIAAVRLDSPRAGAHVLSGCAQQPVTGGERPSSKVPLSKWQEIIRLCLPGIRPGLSSRGSRVPPNMSSRVRSGRKAPSAVTGRLAAPSIAADKD